jgi:hypothetical protein
MKPSEAVPLIGDAEAALQRIRGGLHLTTIAPDDAAARMVQTDTALEVFALYRTVDRLARLAGMSGPTGRRPKLRPPHDAPAPIECDRCGGPANEYGDCIAGSHVR